MQFPLYRAPLLPTYFGPRVCVACRQEVQESFFVHVLIVPCRRCGEATGLDMAEHITDCVHCGEFHLWPTDLPYSAVCAPCLAAGRAAISRDSEVGLVTWSTARLGLVEVSEGESSEKAARREGFEIWTDEWGPPVTYARIPPEPLLELLRTPDVNAVQGVYWPFHCGRFCAFLGNWKQPDFDRHFGGRGQELFEATLDRDSNASWDQLAEGFPRSFVFQCLKCQALRVFVDSA